MSYTALTWTPVRNVTAGTMAPYEIDLYRDEGAPHRARCRNWFRAALVQGRLDRTQTTRGEA